MTLTRSNQSHLSFCSSNFWSALRLHQMKDLFNTCQLLSEAITSKKSNHSSTWFWPVFLCPNTSIPTNSWLTLTSTSCKKYLKSQTFQIAWISQMTCFQISQINLSFGTNLSSNMISNRTNIRLRRSLRRFMRAWRNIFPMIRTKNNNRSNSC